MSNNEIELKCLSDCLLKAIETAKQEKYFMTEEYINNALRSLKALKKIDFIKKRGG